MELYYIKYCKMYFNLFPVRHKLWLIGMCKEFKTRTRNFLLIIFSSYWTQNEKLRLVSLDD